MGSTHSMDSFVRDKVVGAWSSSPLSCVEVRYSWSHATTPSHAIMGQIYLCFTTLVAISRPWTTSAVHHYKCDGRVSFLLSISLLQKLSVTAQELLFLQRQSVVFCYHCDRWQHMHVRQWSARKSHFKVTCHASIHFASNWACSCCTQLILVQWRMGDSQSFLFPAVLVRIYLFFCLMTLSISEVYVASNETMIKEWCGKWRAWMCKKKDNLSLYGLMLTEIIFKD